MWTLMVQFNSLNFRDVLGYLGSLQRGVRDKGGLEGGVHLPSMASEVR